MRFLPSRRLACAAAAILAAAALHARGSDAPPDPAEKARLLEAALRPAAAVSSPLGMVVTAAPEASWAGARILEAGGNAVDAAVAAAFALTASEPEGSGLGGQTWMVVRLASGQERAILCPAPVPMRVDTAKVASARREKDLWGPMAAAVPTTVATLAHALRRYGTKSFAEVLAPAIEAAEGGYRTQGVERAFLGDYVLRLWDSEVLCPLYLTEPKNDSGYPQPGPAGSCVRLPRLAETLRRLAAAGPEDFYSGEIAARLDAEMVAAGGFVRLFDLRRVPASVRDVAPARGTYRGLTILSVPSPAGGGVLVAAAQILDALPPETLAAPGLARGQAIVEAVRLARAKSATRTALVDVTDGPLVSEWLTHDWARREAARIRPGRAIPVSELDDAARLVSGDRGTTQVSVVDAQGNAVSLTQSLGRYFGAAWASPSLGFLLNAFVEPLDSTDPASAAYLKPGAALPVPVAPMILVRDDRVALAAGSAGSSRIPSILLGFVTGLVDGHVPPARVGAEPRVLWEDDSAGPRVMLEVAPPFGPPDPATLKAMGYGTVYALTEPDRNLSAFGGVNAVAWDAASSSWLGLIDVRRPGTAAAPARVAPAAR